MRRTRCSSRVLSWIVCRMMARVSSRSTIGWGVLYTLPGVMLVRLRQPDWLIRQLLPGAFALWGAGAAAGAQPPAAESGPAQRPPPPPAAAAATPAGRWPALLGAQDAFLERR